MQGATPGLRERKKAETREALRAAAIQLLLERGPSAVTVNDICETARVSVRTFFNYFESKEAALFAWDQRLTDELVAELAARPSHEPPLIALRRAMSDTLPGFAAQTGWKARKELFATSPEVRAKVVNALFRVETRLVEALTERIGCPPGSLYPQVLAGVMISVFRAALTTWDPETGIEGLQAYIDQAFDHLADGLTVPAS
jgi:AcrR family transcriptional regulator